MKAISRYIRVSPRKLNLVVGLVRFKTVQDALNILRVCNKSAAKHVEKTILSAVNNASQKGGVNLDALFIKNITVDAGPTMKRYRPASMGRAVMVRKRMSHLKVVLDVR